MTYRPRELAAAVIDGLANLPVVVVTGLRQAGKTTFLREDSAFRDRRYYTLDDFATLEAARKDPAALLSSAEAITIDEAQRCPELLVEIKRAVDRGRRPGRFLLSGSANFALLRGVTETLAGRAVYFTMHPFSRREASGATERSPFLLDFLDRPRLRRGGKADPIASEEILAGGMPSVVLREVHDRRLWFLGYEQTYLQRDVRDLTQVADLVSFRNLLRLTALRTDQVLKQSEIGRDAKLSAATAGRYLGVLEASFVITRLPPFLRSKASRLIKSPKVYIADSGLAAHLTDVDAIDATEGEPLRGALFETYAAQNLAAILAAHRPGTELAFWHVQGRNEVDFVISLGRECVGIEIKASERFEDNDLAGLRAFAANTRGVKALVLAYNGSEAVSLGENLFAVPLAMLLS